jgi:hypothetical protein
MLCLHSTQFFTSDAVAIWTGLFRLKRIFVDVRWSHGVWYNADLPQQL